MISKEERAELRRDIRANCYPDVSGELDTLLDALDAADERIAELEAAAQWRPMDTVPTDGTHVVVCMGFRDGAPHFETRRYIAPPLLGRSTHWRWLPIPEGGA